MTCRRLFYKCLFSFSPMMRILSRKSTNNNPKQITMLGGDILDLKLKLNLGNKVEENITITEVSNLCSLMDNSLISLSHIEVLYNQSSNDTLKKILKDIRDNLTTKMIEKANDILEEAKVEPPSGYSRRDLESKNYQKNDAMLTDAEIASTVLTTLGGSLTYFYYAMLQATNIVIASIYLNFFNDTAKEAGKLMELAIASSWINKPPSMNNIKQ
jgi:hypothetical protein